MILEEALKEANLELYRDALPADQRTVKVFAHLIKELRKAEAVLLKEYQDRAQKAEREANEALKENLRLQQVIQQKDGELLKYRLMDRMTGMNALSVNDRQRLLEIAD